MVTDENLIIGIAASAIDLGLPETSIVLGEMFDGRSLSDIIERIKYIRAQSKSGLSVMPALSDRLSAVRQELDRKGFDGFLVPMADEHQGEFISSRSKRLAWLTGFDGSAGLAVVLRKSAAIFVDGRYTLQVRRQVNTEIFQLGHLKGSCPQTWLCAQVSKGSRIGFDPWLHTATEIKNFRKACIAANIELVAVDANPLDAVWSAQPPRPLGPVVPHLVAFAGATSLDKREEIASVLGNSEEDALVLSEPGSIAWLLNIRGSDVPNTPLALCYAIVYQTGCIDWFIDPRKLTLDTRKSLDDGVRVFSPGSFIEGLRALGEAGKTIRLDCNKAPEAVRSVLEQAGANIVDGLDICALPRAKKNIVEVAGARSAHIRDGVAVTSFLAWLFEIMRDHRVNEIEAANKLLTFRQIDPKFRGNSFNTISGSGPNGAIVHYQATPHTNRYLSTGDLYLVDSGGQYLDGTTDVTRTVYIDDGEAKEVSMEIKERFTRVLKGHIAIARARFPKGTCGSQIDVLARLALWEEGLDYDHGTGHGVGSYLGVHEGPQRISKQGGSVPLEPGMILSNEPGYYKEGAYGIRIENLVVVTECTNTLGSREGDLLEFETITLVPIDLNLVVPEMLTEFERGWLNTYHARVRATLSPLVNEGVCAWLRSATEEL
ncbi:MAG: aminopeptidase P family protein [Pseudomonadota bacterium]|nr:aminopeptidase P family protein [Pseudomonadota bacterium]